MRKNHYDILGVDPNATPEEIKKAYYQRIKVVHPDRFDKNTQPSEWKAANEMLAELNEAYFLIKQEQEASSCKNNSKSTFSKSNDEPSKEIKSVLNIINSGQIDIRRFDTETLNNIIDLFSKESTDTFIVLNHSHDTRVLYAIGSVFYLILSPFIFKSFSFGIFLGLIYTFSLYVSWLFIRNSIGDVRTRLKRGSESLFMISPLYVLHLEGYVLSYEPIYNLKKFNFKSDAGNLSPTNYEIECHFKNDKKFQFSISSKEKLENLQLLTKTLLEKWNRALGAGDVEYFKYNNFLNNVLNQKDKDLKSIANPSDISNFFSLLLVGLSLSGMLYLKQYNQPISSNESGNNQAIKSGLDTLSQKKDIDNTTDEERRVAEIQEWEASHLQYPLPVNGAKKKYIKEKSKAPFKINTAEGQYYLVLLKDVGSGNKVIRLFIHGGQTVETKVPVGSFIMQYASGQKWFGYKYLFGPSGSYTEAEDTLTFSVEGNRLLGNEISLFSVTNGNLSTQPIDSTSFGSAE